MLPHCYSQACGQVCEQLASCQYLQVFLEAGHRHSNRMTREDSANSRRVDWTPHLTDATGHWIMLIKHYFCQEPSEKTLRSQSSGERRGETQRGPFWLGCRKTAHTPCGWQKSPVSPSRRHFGHIYQVIKMLLSDRPSPLPRNYSMKRLQREEPSVQRL